MACQANAWCEAGDEFGRNCPSGTHVAAPGSSTSAACVACAAGEYCPVGAGLQTCPAGTYQATASAGTCTPAPEGKAAPTTASTSVPASCAAGTHAKTGATGCHPCPAGFQCPGDSTEVLCSIGSYSPAGLAACTACVPGQLCLRAGMSAPEPCPSGHYCPDPATAPVAAPVGSFSFGGTGATGLAATQACHSGYTCTTTGAIGPHAAPCEAGFLSGAGETVCRATSDGAYTLRGAGAETACPLGYYCAQAEAYYPLPCPKGTFGAGAGLTAASGCTPCTGGKSCDMPGLTPAFSLGDCDEGYFCTAGAWTPRPRGDIDAAEGATGGLCTEGHYCPSGTTAPAPCPSGTYLASPGMTREADCLACPAGSFCGGAGSSAPTGTCQAGSFCPEGSASATASQTRAGHYTPSGSASEIACAPGSYASSAGQAACTACDAGSHCATTGLEAGSPCQAGAYCPSGAVRPRACLAGSYQPTAAASDSGACLPCPAGKVCPTEGLSAQGTDCAAGYICYSAAWTATPAISLATPTAASGGCATAYADHFGLCPPGHHCAAGSTCPTRCPAGTYQPAEGATAASFCLTCPAGSHCDTAGLSAPSGLCPGGYYCPAGAQSATALVCPPGHQCPEGAPDKASCAPGTSTKSAAGGALTCTECLEGTYCLAANEAPVPCPVNHYCPAATTHADAFPCPAGTSTGGSAGATALAGCISLGAADWIKGPGWGGGVFTGPSYGGAVEPGYLNSAGGATHSRPSGASLCPRGATCTGGVSTPCPVGQFCSDFGLAQAGGSATTGSCSAGHWCPEAATSPVPNGVAA